MISGSLPHKHSTSITLRHKLPQPYSSSTNPQHKPNKHEGILVNSTSTFKYSNTFRVITDFHDQNQLLAAMSLHFSWNTSTADSNICTFHEQHQLPAAVSALFLKHINCWQQCLCTFPEPHPLRTGSWAPDTGTNDGVWKPQSRFKVKHV